MVCCFSEQTSVKLEEKGLGDHVKALLLYWMTFFYYYIELLLFLNIVGRILALPKVSVLLFQDQWIYYLSQPKALSKYDWIKDI